MTTTLRCWPCGRAPKITWSRTLRQPRIAPCPPFRHRTQTGRIPAPAKRGVLPAHLGECHRPDRRGGPAWPPSLQQSRLRTQPRPRHRTRRHRFLPRDPSRGSRPHPIRLRAHAGHGQGQRAEYRLLLRDGAVRYIESLGSVVLDESGRPDKIVVVSRDITERRQAMDELQLAHSQLQQAHEELHAAQARLVQTEKIEALSTFAAGIAHEVRNPLQTILLGIDFLRESLRDPVRPTPPPNNWSWPTWKTRRARRTRSSRGSSSSPPTASRKSRITISRNSSNNRSRRSPPNWASAKSRSVSNSIPNLPMVNVDARKIRHVLIKLMLGLADRLPPRPLTLRTCLGPQLGRQSAFPPRMPRPRLRPLHRTRARLPEPPSPRGGFARAESHPQGRPRPDGRQESGGTLRWHCGDSPR
jgi:hypothetical protein